MATAIDRDELLRLTESEDAQIVDVLPRPEYDESHLPSDQSPTQRAHHRDCVRALTRQAGGGLLPRRPLRHVTTSRVPARTFRVRPGLRLCG